VDVLLQGLSNFFTFITLKEILHFQCTTNFFLNKKLKVEPYNFIVNQPCIQFAMGSVYCLLCVGLNISTVVMEPNVLAGY